MTLSEHQITWLFGLIAAGGAFQALTLWRLWTIERKIGNGSPGIFVQRREFELIVDSAKDTHHDIKRRLDALEREGA